MTSYVLHSFLTGLSGIVLLGYLETVLEFMLGSRSVPRLDHYPLPEEPSDWPKVSVIIPARNEERHLRQALASVLHLDYPNYELLVLDDRSEDRTGEILEEMGRQYPMLRVQHITSLPPGWLGKNHALAEGAKLATGDILLFTDADVVMRPDTLRRTVAYLQAERIDHLALMPEIQSSGLGLSLFLNAFSIYFSLYARPWLARCPKSKAFIGVGAFNMLRRHVYEQIGTHQAIALRPDDDMKLGKLVKRHGFRQQAGNGLGLLRIEWYASLNELIRGLMKNAFAGLEYNLLLVLGGVTAQFLFGVWPFLAIFCTSGLVWWINLTTFLLMQWLCFSNARYAGLNRFSGLLFPFSSLLMIFIVLRGTVLNLLQNGIYWRDTYYSLDELRMNRV